VITLGGGGEVTAGRELHGGLYILVRLLLDVGAGYMGVI
jgi:hypothetical protein